MSSTICGEKHRLSETDNEGSPECLCSEPARDPYSSDEEKKKVKKSKIFDGRKLYRMSVDEPVLKEYFDMRYCPILTHPTPQQMAKMDMCGILDELMYFFTNRKDVSAKEVIEKVLSYGTSEIITYIHKQKEFHVNFKQCTSFPQIVNTKYSTSSFDRLARELMSNLCKVLKMSRESESFNSTDHHNTVKGFCYSLARIVMEDLKQNGEFVHEIHATKKSSQHGARNVPDEKSFQSHPDLCVGGSERSPVIPIDVYSPFKEITVFADKDEHTEKQDKTKRDSKITPDKISTDENLDWYILKFLTENITPCILKQLLQGVSHFQHAITAQHVLEMIAIAVHYSLHKAWQKNQSDKRTVWKNNRTFIGLFVINEYVCIGKLIGNEIDFAEFGIPKKSVSPFESMEGMSYSVLSERGPIYVKFCPFVLDTSVHSHRMALLFFMKYYINEWDEIYTNFEVEK